MTTLTVTLSSICAGGGHLTFTISGARTATVPLTVADITEPITEEDVVSFCKVIARMAKAGRTVAQARSLLQAGVTVTI